MKARGGKELDKYLDGGRITQRQAILAKCFDCTNQYGDGREDCNLPECPLYPWMPFRHTEIPCDALQFKRKSNLTPEQRDKIATRLAQFRKHGKIQGSTEKG